MLDCAQRGDRPATTAGTDAPRPLPLLRLGHARAAGDGAVRRGAPAPVARAARRLRGELPRARRADEPPRPREPRGARGGARGVPGNGAARLPRPRACSTPSRAARSRSRTARVRSYDGGWADYARLASERAMSRGQTQGQSLSQTLDTSKKATEVAPAPAKRPRAHRRARGGDRDEGARGRGARASPRGRLGERRHGRRLPARARGARGSARHAGSCSSTRPRRSSIRSSPWAIGSVRRGTSTISSGPQQRFRALLEEERTDAGRAEVLTQLAPGRRPSRAASTRGTRCSTRRDSRRLDARRTRPHRPRARPAAPLGRRSRGSAAAVRDRVRDGSRNPARVPGGGCRAHGGHRGAGLRRPGLPGRTEASSSHVPRPIPR